MDTLHGHGAGMRLPRNRMSRFELLNQKDLLSRLSATLSSTPNGGEGRGEERQLNRLPAC